MSNAFDSGMNYRQPGPAEPSIGGAITVITEGDDGPEFDPSTGTTQVELPDGDVQITFGPPDNPQ